MKTFIASVTKIGKNGKPLKRTELRLMWGDSWNEALDKYFELFEATSCREVLLGDVSARDIALMLDKNMLLGRHNIHIDVLSIIAPIVGEEVAKKIMWKIAERGGLHK